MTTLFLFDILIDISALFVYTIIYIPYQIVVSGLLAMIVFCLLSIVDGVTLNVVEQYVSNLLSIYLSSLSFYLSHWFSSEYN